MLKGVSIRRLFRTVALFLGCFLGQVHPAQGQVDARLFTLILTAQGQAPRITISWTPDIYASSYKVSRKVLGGTSWSQLAVLPASAASFQDGNVPEGSAFEYQVEEITTDGHSLYGYLYAGNMVSLPATRGKLILIVDRTHANDLAFELTRLEQDLIGDGWTVIRHDVGRTDSVGSVRNLIRTAYYSDPANVRSIFLFGHVPVPYSGDINPDMHAGHKGAWPADVYYADVDGNWTDFSVSNNSSEDIRNVNVPGDGKFDQSLIPSAVELEIGRVDLSDMPAFSPKSEKDLLRQYLQKNNRFRHKQLTAGPRALVHDNFGEIEGDLPKIDAWRNFPGFVGLQNIREVGPGQFFDVLSGESHLWAYGAGGGGWDRADGVGSTADFARRDPKAIFTILHGSYFGDWDFPDNFMRAALATASYGLASTWAGLPHWFMHPMALGESLGYVTRLNQNNATGLYKSEVNLSAGMVHIALMGDPTLRMQVVAPPGTLSAQTGQGVSLSWGGAPDTILGYNIYRSSNPKGPFTRLNRSYISTSTYTDGSAPAGQQTYMVRALKLENTASGSFINASQGVFVTVNVVGGPPLPVVTLNTLQSEARETDGQPAQFVLRRTGSTAGPLQVSLNITGTATQGIDYEQVGNPVTIPAGQSELNVVFRPRQDSVEEGTESIVISISGNAAYQIGNPGIGQVLILDTPVNHAPTLSVIPNQNMNEDAVLGPLNFTVADADSPPETLSVTATSLNQNLLPDSGMNLSGSGATRTLVLRPGANLNGSVVISIRVSDGQLNTTRSFSVTVNPVNDPPQIGTIADQTIVQDQTSSDVAFSVLDFETVASGLSVTATSANPSLIPNSGIVFGGANTGRTLRLTPAPGQTGGTQVTVTVSDGQASATRTFQVTVQAGNRPPPRITSVSSPSSAQVQLSFSGLPGKTWVIERSGNLNTWNQAGTGTANDDKLISFTDANDQKPGSRFYRLLWR